MTILSALSHVSLGTDDLERSERFYTAVLATLGIVILERIDDVAIAYGRQFPEFWLNLPLDEKPASVGNGTHVAFLAPDRASVDAFYLAALDAGADDEGAPDVRPHYGSRYYGCFLRDWNGHKIEVMHGWADH